MAQAEPAPVEPEREVIDDEYLEIARSIERGMWIEFEADDGQLAFAKLAWISPLRGTYLFTNRQGQKALSMTAEELAEQFRTESRAAGRGRAADRSCVHACHRRAFRSIRARDRIGLNERVTAIAGALRRALPILFTARIVGLATLPLLIAAIVWIVIAVVAWEPLTGALRATLRRRSAGAGAVAADRRAGRSPC